MRTLKLPENLMILIVNLPQNETGHRMVKIYLKNGKVLRNHRVINSEILILEDYEEIYNNDIEKIELEEQLQIELP